MNENTLSANLERIKNAVDDIREITNMPTETIEEVTEAVRELKIEGVDCVDSIEAMEEIENPVEGEVCIIQSGPIEIEWDNTNINTNILVFPQTTHFEGYPGEDAFAAITLTGDPQISGDIGAVESTCGGELAINMTYDNVILAVRYHMEQDNQTWRLNTLLYSIDGEPQTVIDNVVKLPWCIKLHDYTSAHPIDTDVTSAFIHTYQVLPWDSWDIISQNGIIIKDTAFTLSKSFDEFKAQWPVESMNIEIRLDKVLIGNITFDRDSLTTSINGQNVTYESDDQQTYEMRHTSSSWPYNIICNNNPDIWLDNHSSGWMDIEPLSEVLGYIPEPVYKIYIYKASQWLCVYDRYETE